MTGKKLTIVGLAGLFLGIGGYVYYKEREKKLKVVKDMQKFICSNIYSSDADRKKCLEDALQKL